jgi:acetyl esterase
MGFVVFNIDYRLAPTHKFPAAFDDAARALAWVREQAPKYGGDASRIVIAGESAGGNLTASLVHIKAGKLHPIAVTGALGIGG